MTDGFPDRLTQLRARWQGDPSSRVFLQLAEEYRHLGRVQDALEVLESGLKEHPGYLSALVAKGRCLLELGEAGKARGVLERVVQQDATQMVANKLLVRAYLETGEPERAGQRLDLYSLLNDSDPEIAELRRRVVAMSRPPRVPDGPRPEEPAERPGMDPSETPAAEVFDLGPAAPVRSFDAADDVFGLGSPEASPAGLPTPAAAAAATPGATTSPAASAGPIPPSAPALRGASGDGGGNGAEPFPDPQPENSRRLYLASFAAEQIFWFDEGVEEATPEPAAAAEAAEAAAVASPTAEAVVTAAPVDQPEMAAAPTAETPAAAPVHEPAAAAAPAAESPAPAAAAQTVTLAELYLRQGHTEEAERIFGEIVEREPGNTAAREGLARLAGRAATAGTPRQGQLDAGQLLAGLNDPHASPTARRTYLLQSYLARLRQPRRPHVP